VWKGPTALVFVTEWERFRELDLDRIKQAMAVMVDGSSTTPRR
jgi:hypothetical protein